jgi:SAM-dependent methyltransferase
MDDIMYRVHAELEEEHWWFVAKNNILLHLIRHYRSSAPSAGQNSRFRPRALDVGCGAGGLLACLAHDFDAVGVDMSPIARAYCADRGLTVVDGALPDGLPFDDGAFDVIVASEVLEHIEDDRGSVVTLSRLLRSGGLLLCTSPAHQWMWSQHDDANQHKRRYTRRRFEELFHGLPLNRLVTGYSMCAMFPVLAALRVTGRVFGVTLGAGQAKNRGEVSVRVPTAPVNRTLCALFECEKWILPHVALPMGSSIISVHRRV